MTMTRNTKNPLDGYFNWIYHLMCPKIRSFGRSYVRLFETLYSREFDYSNMRRMDENRYSDGVSLRRRYLYDNGDVDSYLFNSYAKDAPCSILEMMAALAVRCEESMMTNTEYGDRTAQWFWYMINSLGLGQYSDDAYDETEVNDIINCFLDCNYEADGHGGLFIVNNAPRDLRTVDIWTQMNWYLATII